MLRVLELSVRARVRNIKRSHESKILADVNSFQHATAIEKKSETYRVSEKFISILDNSGTCTYNVVQHTEILVKE